MRKAGWVAGMGLVLLGFRPAAAHHSFAASFDGGRKITLDGIVTKVEWSNPHMYFFLSVRGNGGKTVNWVCEAAGPNALVRHGWSRDLIRSGEMIRVIGYPARGGSPVASAREIILEDGRKLVGGSPYDGGPLP